TGTPTSSHRNTSTPNNNPNATATTDASDTGQLSPFTGRQPEGTHARIPTHPGARKPKVPAPGNARTADATGPRRPADQARHADGCAGRLGADDWTHERLPTRHPSAPCAARSRHARSARSTTQTGHNRILKSRQGGAGSGPLQGTGGVAACSQPYTSSHTTMAPHRHHRSESMRGVTDSTTTRDVFVARTGRTSSPRQCGYGVCVPAECVRSVSPSGQKAPHP
ncbi:MAG: hypothetical protein JWP76_2338, partial [Dactylosporangium sp.]|nr:hypothetical protein [Dactylosporangium sp.]